MFSIYQSTLFSCCWFNESMCFCYVIIFFIISDDWFNLFVIFLHCFCCHSHVWWSKLQRLAMADKTALVALPFIIHQHHQPTSMSPTSYCSCCNDLIAYSLSFSRFLFLIEVELNGLWKSHQIRRINNNVHNSSHHLVFIFVNIVCLFNLVLFSWLLVLMILFFWFLWYDCFYYYYNIIIIYINIYIYTGVFSFNLFHLSQSSSSLQY